MATQSTATPNVVYLLLGDLVPSTTNRSASIAAIAEMAESIVKNGVLQPIIVRPLKGGSKGSYEIVCGEVRWRGAQTAKLETIPAIVRNYSDQEAQAAQIIENLQRSNPGPMDEARAYENLRKLIGKAATIEGIAAQVGKDAPYVAQRLKLLTLIGEAKTALEAGHLGIGHGLAIAPLQDWQQKACLKWLGYEEHLEGNWGPHVRSVHSLTALRAFIEGSFMLELDKAPFDVADTKLNPKMGACAACPYNTSNTTSLFPDIKGARCTNAPCFFGKRDAAFEITVAQLTEKNGGKKLYRLALGGQQDNQGPAKVKVDGKLATDSWESGPRQVRAGDECKDSQTAVVAYIATNTQTKAKIGNTLTICANAKCGKHGGSSGHRESVSGGAGRLALKGMAFVDHKEGNLKKSLTERLRFATFKAVVGALLKLDEPGIAGGLWTDRIVQLGLWGFEQIGHDQKRDAVKALGLWPKEKKASEMDFGQVLTDHFKGKPWAFTMAILAMQDIRNPYHDHGEPRGRRYAGEPKDQEHGLFFLAQSFKVDVGKIYDGLKSEDKAVVGKMTDNVQAREAKAKPKVPKVKKGTKVDQSGSKGTKAAKKVKKAK